MFLRIKMLKIDKKKKKLSFIKSAKIIALLFLVTNKVGKRDQELFIYLIVYNIFIFSIMNNVFSLIAET